MEVYIAEDLLTQVITNKFKLQTMHMLLWLEKLIYISINLSDLFRVGTYEW